jgi:hypothetical protein
MLFRGGGSSVNHGLSVKNQSRDMYEALFAANVGRGTYRHRGTGPGHRAGCHRLRRGILGREAGVRTAHCKAAGHTGISQMKIRAVQDGLSIVLLSKQANKKETKSPKT